MSNPVSISENVIIGAGQPLTIIAGPCQIESREHALSIAQALIPLQRRYPVRLIYKSSYDKANRTSLSGKRGLGIDAGLAILREVRQETGLPVLTDVHSPEEAAIAGKVVDVLQTPAFLCRQTDLLCAVGATDRVVNVKKGQFLAPQDMRHVADKIASTGNRKILLCERGSCFGYRDLIVDMRSLSIMREIGYPVIFDATHSVQSMGGTSGMSGGSREFIAPLSRAAVAVGIDGIFIECHEDPDHAPSDGPSMLPLPALEPLVSSLCKLRDAVRSA